MPAATTAWQIGGVEVSWLEADQPDLARGESDTFEVRLVPDGRGNHVGRYEQLMAYQPHMGEFDTYQAIKGTIRYREQHTRTSLLTAVVPPTDDPTGRGVWGLIEQVSDSTEVPQKKCLVAVDVLYLAALDEFADKQAVRDALEATGP